MQERRRLRAVQLSGKRAVIRTVLSYGMAAFAALGALGYVLPAHRVAYGGAFHSNFADGGPASLVVFAGVIIMALGLRRRGFGAGIAIGVVATAGAVLALAPVFLEHFLSHVDYAIGENVFATGILGLFFGGAVTAIAEPILFITQRRALEREDPQFPAARVVNT